MLKMYLSDFDIIGRSVLNQSQLSQISITYWDVFHNILRQGNGFF